MPTLHLLHLSFWIVHLATAAPPPAAVVPASVETVQVSASRNALVPDDVREPLYRKLEVLAEVLAQIQLHYVDAISPTDLIYNAAHGAVDALDAHSAFYTPDEYRTLIDATEGEFAGIGLEIDTANRLQEVVCVMEHSPAQQAGLRVGDLLVRIDDQALDDYEFDAVWRLLRGAVGSPIKLQIQHPGDPKQQTMVLQRAWVRVEPFETRTLGDVTYVRLKSFSRHVAGQLKTQLQQSPPRLGLVIDLRGNPGGLFDEAVAVCDLFLRDGPIVTAMGRGGKVIDQPVAHAEGTQPDYRLAVLIDHGSASAAEIVAGALRDRGRARLFGARSYGKGSVQSILDLTDGAGLKLTIARYYTPSGKLIDHAGIEPDEVYPTDPADQSHDRVLAAAIDFMRAPEVTQHFEEEP